MIAYKTASSDDIELLMSSRLEMLKVVNNLPADYVYAESFIEASRKFFLEGNQTTILAMDGEKVIGCASMVYVIFMPTFSHPTGKRAHLMNVYTNQNYRRQGIGVKMVQSLIDEAKSRGCTEIGLDATQAGKPLYEKLGFIGSDSYMFMNI